MHSALALLIFLVVGSTLALRDTTPAGAGAAEVAFSPPSSSRQVGADINVNITVANVNDLGGYDVFIQFDPAVIRMTSLADAGFVTSGGNIVVCNDATIDNVAGTGTDSCATVSPFGLPGPGVSSLGSTALLNASFEAVGQGVSSLTLTNTELHDPDGLPISATFNSGSIAVTGPGGGEVGGLAELPDVDSPNLDDAEGNSGGFPVFPLALMLALLTAIIVGVGYALRLSRRAGES